MIFSTCCLSSFSFFIFHFFCFFFFFVRTFSLVAQLLKFFLRLSTLTHFQPKPISVIFLCPINPWLKTVYYTICFFLQCFLFSTANSLATVFHIFSLRSLWWKYLILLLKIAEYFWKTIKSFLSFPTILNYLWEKPLDKKWNPNRISTWLSICINGRPYGLRELFEEELFEP